MSRTELIHNSTCSSREGLRLQVATQICAFILKFKFPVFYVQLSRLLPEYCIYLTIYIIPDFTIETQLFFQNICDIFLASLYLEEKLLK